jgi:hypothetical protein
MQVPVPALLDPDEDEDWRRVALAEFLKGYADSDAIYDQFSPA